eukprot:3019202-Prymnesium_polylepis.1
MAPAHPQAAPPADPVPSNYSKYSLDSGTWVMGGTRSSAPEARRARGAAPHNLSAHARAECDPITTRYSYAATNTTLTSSAFR